MKLSPMERYRRAVAAAARKAQRAYEACYEAERAARELEAVAKEVTFRDEPLRLLATQYPTTVYNRALEVGSGAHEARMSLLELAELLGVRERE